MDKQNTYVQWNIIQPWNEENIDTYYNMNEPWRHAAEWNKPVQKDKYFMIPFMWIF